MPLCPDQGSYCLEDSNCLAKAVVFKAKAATALGRQLPERKSNFYLFAVGQPPQSGYCKTVLGKAVPFPLRHIFQMILPKDSSRCITFLICKAARILSSVEILIKPTLFIKIKQCF
jgi:hypothetical protein